MVGSLYVYRWKYCGISRAMVWLCATAGVSPAPLSHLCWTAGVIFPLQTNHVEVLKKMKFLFYWTALLSSLILPVFPHVGSYQLSPTGPCPCVVENMAEQAALGWRQHFTEKMHYFAAIKAPQTLLQHPAPSSHEPHKPHDRQSYLSTQFILLDEAFLLLQLQMPCL